MLGTMRQGAPKLRGRRTLERIRRGLMLLLAVTLAGAPAPRAAADRPAASEALRRLPPLDDAVEHRILALDPEHISPAEVRDVLRHAPAPRIIGLQGSFPLITMQPFAEYLIAMGYPEARLKDPRDGSMSRNSFSDSERLAGELAWYYENEGMMPMLIGHSQGGMLAI
jgi:hypothetical protein